MTRLRHLVVVIPGIGGSVLDGPGPPAGPISGGGYALTAAGLARTLALPGRLDLERYPQLTPSGLVRDLALLPPLLTLPGYQRLNLHLRNAFLDAVIQTYRPPAAIDPRTDVLKLPYDFRQSIVAATQRLDDAVGEALRRRSTLGASRGPDKPVIILAHSLGGLVAGYWVTRMGGWRHCAAVITLGTPHRGAPKALDWLVNGVGVGRLRDSRGTRVIRGWPSMYELLPQYEAVLDAQTGSAVELTCLPDALVAGRPALAEYAPIFAKMAAAGRLVHEQIRAGWAALDPRQAPALVPFLTRGHATPNLATLTGERLRVSKEDPPWRGNVGWRGDGTVPALSAIPPELGGDPHLWRVVADRHGPLGSIAAPIDVLRSYAGDRVPTRGGELPDRPWLGLDIEDFALAGDPIPVEAELLPAPLPGGTAWVSVTAIEGVGGPVHRDRLTHDGQGPGGGSRWRGTVPPLMPGWYEVAVEVMDVPGVESVAHTYTLLVGDPAEGMVKDETGVAL